MKSNIYRCLDIFGLFSIAKTSITDFVIISVSAGTKEDSKVAALINTSCIKLSSVQSIICQRGITSLYSQCLDRKRQRKFPRAFQIKL